MKVFSKTNGGMKEIFSSERKSKKFPFSEAQMRTNLEEVVPRFTKGKLSGPLVYDRILDEIKSGRAKFIQYLDLLSYTRNEWGAATELAEGQPKPAWADYHVRLLPENVTLDVFFMPELNILKIANRVS